VTGRGAGRARRAIVVTGGDGATDLGATAGGATDGGADAAPRGDEVCGVGVFGTTADRVGAGLPETCGGGTVAGVVDARRGGS
jgi:hypothetical protein